MPKNIIPQLLNYQTLFIYYGLYQSTMSKLVMQGKFVNLVKIGRKNYFHKDDVEKWIKSNTVHVSQQRESCKPTQSIKTPQ